MQAYVQSVPLSGEYDIRNYLTLVNAAVEGKMPEFIDLCKKLFFRTAAHDLEKLCNEGYSGTHSLYSEIAKDTELKNRVNLAGVLSEIYAKLDADSKTENLQKNEVLFRQIAGIKLWAEANPRVPVVDRDRVLALQSEYIFRMTSEIRPEILLQAGVMDSKVHERLSLFHKVFVAQAIKGGATAPPAGPMLRFKDR